MALAYWKNVPIITIDNNTIHFGQQTFYLMNIKDVGLKGKKPFRFLMDYPMEGTSILFSDGTEKVVFDDMYTNSWEIKSFLDQTVVNKQAYRPIMPNSINKNSISFEAEEIFKGNQFTSFRGIILWGFIGFLAYMAFGMNQNPPIGVTLLLVALGIFLFLISSVTMYYFGLTQDYLIIRNHNFIRKLKIYSLADIREVVFEAADSRQAHTMRVITKDFRYKLYPAGTLRDKTWLDLKNKLEMKGVVVRNECIYAY